MAKVSRCFRRVFIFFNVGFWIAGALLLAQAILGNVDTLLSEEFNPIVVGVIFQCIVGGVIMAISFLGVYGAYVEKKWALIVFAASMVLGFCGLLLVAVPMMVSRPTINLQLETQLLLSMPLGGASPEFLRATDKFQSELKCCGIFDGYIEWGSRIPPSCFCPRQYQAAGRCERVETAWNPEATKEDGFLDQLFGRREYLVYKEPCFPALVNAIDNIFDVFLGGVFVFAFMAMIGLMMSLVLLCNMKGAVTGKQAIFSLSLDRPGYDKLHNMS